MQASRRRVALPKRSPVTALHLCADNDVNGNPRRVFVVMNHEGRFVEAIDEGYEGDGALYKRWPWFHSSVALRHDIKPAYTQRLDVEVSEYRRQLRRESYEGTEAVRRLADRYERAYDSLGHER
jgi:3-dehydroquinate dehydratase